MVSGAQGELPREGRPTLSTALFLPGRRCFKKGENRPHCAL